ncbi:hypothetical protein 162300060 [Organic Lake phycodnavirus 2]|nr:hypothetical protein 162300060 [Organic Lake phycodnavirus 2]
MAFGHNDAQYNSLGGTGILFIVRVLIYVSINLSLISIKNNITLYVNYTLDEVFANIIIIVF